jgi:ribosomal protein S18 acetylase RimI-like enzyme
MVTLVRVHPEHQRRGVGRALCAHLDQHLADMHCGFLLSSTEEDNERSLLFHKALGFREIGHLAELEQPVREVFLRRDLG